MLRGVLGFLSVSSLYLAVRLLCLLRMLRMPATKPAVCAASLSLPALGPSPVGATAARRAARAALQVSLLPLADAAVLSFLSPLFVAVLRWVGRLPLSAPARPLAAADRPRLLPLHAKACVAACLPAPVPPPAAPSS